MEGQLGPRARHIYHDLRRQIEVGELPLGAALRSQTVLAREYGVAVMTVRQALERLEGEGYVRARVGAGTYVETSRPAPATSIHALRSILEAAPLPIVSIDAADIVRGWNPAAERMFGWTEAEALHSSLPFVPEENRAEHQDFLRDTLGGKRLEDVEVVRRRRDGTLLTLSLSTAPLHDAEGEIVGCVFSYLDLTERNRVREALRESRERFEQAFSCASIGMSLVRLDGRWLQVNRALCDLVGYSEDELLGMCFQDITHPADLDDDLAHVERLLAGEIDSYQMEKRYIRKDGNAVWVRLAVSLVRSSDGAPLYFVSQIEDITESKGAHEALRRSERGLRDLVQGAPVGVCITSQDGVFEQVNPAFACLVGYTVEELLGKHHSSLFSAHDGSRPAKKRVDRFERSVRALDEFDVVRKDGSCVTVLSTSVPLAGPDDVPRRAAFVIDISERKGAEEALAASERRIRTLIEKAPLGICLVDDQGTLEHVNDAYAAMLGYTANDLAGRHFSVLAPPDELERMAEWEQRHPEKPRGVRLGEYELLHREGRRVTVLTTTVPYDETDPGKRATFALDISDRKQVEQEWHHQATHDALTGLANRLLLQDRVRQIIAHARRNGEVAGVLFIDLDGFKTMNDRFGHDCGDELLKEVSRRLQSCTRASDTIARLAGDEFVVVLPDVGSAAHAARIAEKLLAAVGEPLEICGQAVVMAASVGISVYPFDGDTFQTLLHAADQALYRAKRQGRGSFAFSNVEMSEA